MKMLPVPSLYDEATDAEATRSDGKARADSGAARAVRRSRSREQADNPGRVRGSVRLSPETCNSAAGNQKQDPEERITYGWTSVRRSGTAGADSVVGGRRSHLQQAAKGA